MSVEAARHGDDAPWYRTIVRALGPGLITGASDDDPSGIATYSQAGAVFGFSLSWTMLVSYPLMAAIQEISARIGRTTGRGIAANTRRCYPRSIHAIVVLLLAANTINIAADLSAMADAVAYLAGGARLLHVVLLAALSAALPIVVSYGRYAAGLRWLTLALLAYFGTLASVHVPWSEVLRGLLVPTFSADASFWTMVVAILGTTISPYLFFWQASQEVEEVRTCPERAPLTRAPGQFPGAIDRIRIDTYLGMGLSNLVALAIIITTAATLHASGVTSIETSADAARALEPIAGRFAAAIFALGILGTGLLAVPVLAGSAAYAVGEAFRWPVGLSRAPQRAKRFYATLVIATLVGAALNLLAFSPIKALFWSAVINGIVSVPLMVIMMLIAGNRRIMGSFPVTGALRLVGWAATAVMGLAAAGMLATSLFG